MKYTQQFSGEWFKPIMKGYKMACCDCGLVHKVEFSVLNKNEIQMRVWRDERATSQKRRYKK